MLGTSVTIMSAGGLLDRQKGTFLELKPGIHMDRVWESLSHFQGAPMNVDRALVFRKRRNVLALPGTPAFVSCCCVVLHGASLTAVGSRILLSISCLLFKEGMHSNS